MTDAEHSPSRAAGCEEEQEIISKVTLQSFLSEKASFPKTKFIVNDH